MKNLQKKFKNIPSAVVESGFGVGLVMSSAASIKRGTVYRFYWGRGGAYKQAFHIIILLLTVIVFISGLSNRVMVVGANSLASFDANIGNTDLLQQGTSINSVLAVNPSTSFKIHEYKVKEGDTIKSIAQAYGVSDETVKWANMDKYGDYVRYTEDKIFPGEIIRIPEVTGVLHDVKEGDSLDSIVSKTGADKFTVIEVNRLDAPNYSLAGRKTVLVPEGKLNPPAKPQLQFQFGGSYVASTRPRPASGDCGVSGEINGIPLSNPLCHQDCSGYVFQRGFTGQYPFHDGVDLSKGSGCPESSMCDGTVIFAGDAGFNNGGFVVKVNCGNGVEVWFFHGDGNIWVSAGQSVSRGDPLMYMGCTGWCSGTHLHFIIKVNGLAVDPAYYVGY